MIRHHVETFFSSERSVFMTLNDENQNILYVPSELRVWSLENETTFVLFYRKKNPHTVF